MTEFSDIKRELHGYSEQFMSLFADRAGSFLDAMEKASSTFEEQSVVIASQKETISAQQHEIAEMTADYEARIDALHAQLNATASALVQKTKDVDALARAVTSMKINGRNIDATAAHALNLVNRSRVGDHLVTKLAGRPERPPSDADTLSDVLKRVPPVEPEAKSVAR